MNRMLKENFRQTINFLFIAFLLSIPILAQTDDPNPNSPTPVLLDAINLTDGSALKIPSGKRAAKTPVSVSASYSKTVLYLANVELLSGEDASAFRVYTAEADGKVYVFPAADLELIDSKNRVYKLVFARKFEDESLNETANAASFSVSVAWRGLESNRVSVSSGTIANLKTYDAEAVQKSLLVKSKLSPDRISENQENAVGYRFSGDRKRFMEQATFGPTVALDERVRRLGLKIWLNEQFDAPYPSAANPYPNFPLRATSPPPDCNGLVDNGVPDSDPFCYVNHYTMYPLQNWFYKEAFYGDAQLRHRVAWALAQLWVVSGFQIQQSTHMANYHKVLSRNAFGNWRTLMREMTLSPAMGAYLDMRSSTRQAPNENYAREILQLFNIGLYMIDNQGRVIIDPNTNAPIPTYDQELVNNFTLALTGWTFCEISGGQCPNRVLGAPNFIDPMIVSNTNNVDLATKKLLSYPGSTTTNVPACTGCTGSQITTYANNSLNQVLDNIYNHPNVAPFVSKYLIQQLVTGDPTPAYVGRVAAVFNANRANPAQMKEVIRAILLDPEARGDRKTDPYFGKLREPVLYLTNIARHFDVRSADRSNLSDGVLTTETDAMGQVAFLSPTVFNFYPPDYVVPGTPFVGPEFALFTTGTSIARANVGNTLIFNRVNINPESRVTMGTSLNFDDLKLQAEIDPAGNRLMEVLNAKLLHGTMSDQTRNAVLYVVTTVPESNPLLRVQRAVYLIMTSSQYQVQR